MQAAVARGTSYGTPTEPEVELVEEIVARTPVEKVRLVSSGHRGDDVGDPAGPRLHRPRRRGEVRRLLPRPRRRAARLRRLRAGDLRGPGHPRRTGVLDRADPGAALQRPGRRRGGRSPSTATGSRASITEAAPGNMGVVPPEPGFNALPRRDLPAARRAVRQRRGDDRLPRLPAGAVGPRRRGRGLGAGPDDLRQGDGRRLPGGGVRRPRGRHGAAGAGGPRLPGGHAVGEPGRDHRRPRHPAARHRRRLRAPHPGRRRDQGRDVRRAVGRRRRARRAERRDDVLGLLHRRPGPGLRRRLAHRRRGVRRLLPRHARRGRLPAAVGVRGVVRVRRPRRPGRVRRPRRPARRGPRRGGRSPSARSAGDRDRDPRHHRPPAAPRRGLQPRGRALRPPRRLPPLRPRRPDGRAGGRRDRRARHRARPVLAARARAGDGAAAGHRARASRSSPTSGSSSRPTSSRASGSASATARCASRRPGGTCGTRSSRRGASPTRRSWPG